MVQDEKCSILGGKKVKRVIFPLLGMYVLLNQFLSNPRFCETKPQTSLQVLELLLEPWSRGLDWEGMLDGEGKCVNIYSLGDGGGGGHLRGMG